MMRIRSLRPGHVAAALLSAGLVSATDAAPRNVILFVGDGMGVSTVTAARILEGQMHGNPGEENALSFEEFPALALVKTYTTDMQVPDSAGTMTALVTGVKTRSGVISIGPEPDRGDCEASKAHTLETLLEVAEQAGYRTGIVTTTSITHATPAATYAHAADRNWERRGAIPEESRDACADIAQQFVAFDYGDGIDVAFGGGREMFLPATEADPEDDGATGAREDGRNLVEEWLASGEGRAFAHDQAGFEALPPEAQVLALFEPSHMEFEADRAEDAGGEPSLAEMTADAIDRLANDRGYFLMVEAGRIDHAHHFGNARRALVDTIALADAVAVAAERTDSADTLIVVTADHSHTLTIAGYPVRGNPILDYVRDAAGEPQRDAKGQAYTTLGYANGPGALVDRDAEDAIAEPTDGDYQQTATHAMYVETHAGEDVPAYARGPHAGEITGVMEQNELHGVMLRALFGAESTTGETR